MGDQLVYLRSTPTPYILIPFLVPTGRVGEVRDGDPGAEDGEAGVPNPRTLLLAGVPDPRTLLLILQGGSVNQGVEQRKSSI